MMKRTIYILLIFLVGLIRSAPAQSPDRIKGEIIVQLVSDCPASQLCERLNSYQDIPSGLRLKESLSEEMNIQLLEFDHKSFDEEDFLEWVYSQPDVIAAQFNRKLSYRSNPPNDSLFHLQWQLYNDGSTGGTIDADIDAELAWDTTTGGVTALGDTIVVAVIDDGLDKNHWDFGENLWINYHEIPGNSMDDDSNGYIDDYYGWNTYYNDGDVFTAAGHHGTSVAGIIGARGNNSSGVSGINWKVKLMIIVGGRDEADAIKAYNYVLNMRKLYNETNGQKGAYIVASNASWGVDFLKAEDAPLWCAMYDSLGQHGIVSVGATTNADRDVDATGDLPSLCPSKYLIIATSTNKNDLRSSAGYGKVNVDLGAPGKNVFTTDDTPSEPDGFGYFSGTSASAPMTTGVIALMYAAACKDLMLTAQSRPDSVAFLMRKFLLQGTDIKGSLIGFTLTQGRLNAYNALKESAKFCYNLSLQENITSGGLIESMYPNPVKSTLHIGIHPQFQGNILLELHNMLGQKIVTKKFRDNSLTLDLSDLPPGFYVLSIYHMGSKLWEHHNILKN
jgi:hypothetical protein